MDPIADKTVHVVAVGVGAGHRTCHPRVARTGLSVTVELLGRCGEELWPPSLARMWSGSSPR